jgi:hypothetical protein
MSMQLPTGGPQEDRESLQRLARGQANLRDAGSADFSHLSQMFTSASPEQVYQVLLDAARSVDPQQYHQFLMPGEDGTNPLAALGPESLQIIGQSLLTHLTAEGAGGGATSRLLASVPGLLDADPELLDANQIASLADFARQNYPEALIRSAAEIARSEPSLLQFLLGDQTLRAAGARLAAQFLQQRPA